MKKYVLACVLTVAAVAAWGQEYSPEKDFRVETVRGGVAIVEYLGKATTVNIPPKIGNQSVHRIEPWAFAGTRLVSVTIPNGVVAIGEWAFAANRLTSVTIPASVTSIGDEAFAGNDLSSVTVPRGAVLGVRV
ncbi:MAG: leucine-rich repeat domain-containing protein, partial [Treponema sp.]|nr:leucine-rich repeat domain-containing protein [Treponema sp.]